MNTNFHVAHAILKRKTTLGLVVGLAALMMAFPLIGAEHGGAPHGAFSRPAMTAPGPAMVDRFSHGSIRHIDTHVVPRPIEVRREPAHPVELHHEVMAHRDVDVDIHRWHFWSAFSFGRRLAVLPFGCLALQIGGVPYYYGDGIYYQPADGGYQALLQRNE